MQPSHVAWGIIIGILTADFWLLCMGYSPVTTVIAMGATFWAGRQCGLFGQREMILSAAIAACILGLRVAMLGTDAPPLPEATPLLLFRDRVNERLTRLFPEPEAAFMAGLLTGERSTLPTQVLNDMRRTGLTHILAISGFNITLVLLLLDQALFFVPRQWRLLPSAIGVTAFTLFTGASSSAVRACFMGILNLLALHLGRISQTRLMIGWTAALMVLWNPLQLRDDAGFQLSFFAVIGLCECTPLLKPWMEKLPQTLGIREALTTTIAAQLTAAPWAAYTFGTLPLHSPLLNILIAPLLPLSMLSGALALIGSLLWMPLGLLCAAPGWLMLKAILLIGHLGAMAPVGIVAGLQGSMLFLSLWYGCVIWLLWKAHKRQNAPAAILAADAATHPASEATVRRTAAQGAEAADGSGTLWRGAPVPSQTPHGG